MHSRLRYVSISGSSEHFKPNIKFKFILVKLHSAFVNIKNPASMRNHNFIVSPAPNLKNTNPDLRSVVRVRRNLLDIQNKLILLS